MTLPLSPETTLPEHRPAPKAAWFRPTLDAVDLATETKAGGVVYADTDPNQPGIS